MSSNKSRQPNVTPRIANAWQQSLQQGVDIDEIVQTSGYSKSTIQKYTYNTDVNWSLERHPSMRLNQKEVFQKINNDSSIREIWGQMIEVIQECEPKKKEESMSFLSADDNTIADLYSNKTQKQKILSEEKEKNLQTQIKQGFAARKEIAKRRIIRDKTINQTPFFAQLLHERNQGINAKQTLIKSHLYRVVQVAQANQDSGISLLDLIQEGNLGLIKAIESFEWGAGDENFSEHAAISVQQAIDQYISKNKH